MRDRAQCALSAEVLLPVVGASKCLFRLFYGKKAITYIAAPTLSQKAAAKPCFSGALNWQAILCSDFYGKTFVTFQSAGQMEQYMILWDYQDKGYTHYRLKTNGDNCKECTALNGEVFPIYKAESGVNFVPFHLRHRGMVFLCCRQNTSLA